MRLQPVDGRLDGPHSQAARLSGPALVDPADGADERVRLLRAAVGLLQDLAGSADHGQLKEAEEHATLRLPEASGRQTPPVRTDYY